MKTIFHPSESRGHANHGWLNSYHSFSFANYYDPKKMHFGALRVLNDDRIAPGSGFGKHPHENMEIISIPLEGQLQHEDSTGTNGIIKEGEVQVMSAGTGITHSEMNASKTNECAFLQIWIIPNKVDVEPRYGQKSINVAKSKNHWNEIIAPKDNGQELWIHQDAWMYISEFTKDQSIDYPVKKGNNGVYIFLLEGGIKVGEHQLKRRDAIGVWELNNVNIQVLEDTKLLLIEVPMV